MNLHNAKSLKQTLYKFSNISMNLDMQHMNTLQYILVVQRIVIEYHRQMFSERGYILFDSVIIWISNNRVGCRVLGRRDTCRSRRHRVHGAVLVGPFQRRIQDFKLWGALQIIARKFLGSFVWKITILRKQIIFFSNFRGARPGCTP